MTSPPRLALLCVAALPGLLGACSGSTPAAGGTGGSSPGGDGGARGAGGAATGVGGAAAGVGGARDAAASSDARDATTATPDTAGPDGATRVAPGPGMCPLPAAASDTALQAAYARWKTDLVTADGAGGFLRVRRPNSGTINSSNSEGIGYGMTIAVYLDDQALFDSLWKYEQLWRDANGLMNWEINAQGTAPTGTGAATDGDEDMAFALIMADKKWGGRGTLADTYLNFAKKQIGLIWTFEVDHTRGDVLTPGDQFGGGQIINISYFAPAYYRIFGAVAGTTADWTRVVESTYSVLQATLNTANGNRDNGLVPAWSTPAGVPMSPPGLPTNHQLDSSRTPFRIAQDYCWFREARAQAYLEKISAFYAGIGATHIVDAYALNGSPMPNLGLNLAAFVGPAGVGAMATPAFAGLRNDAYAAVASLGLLGGSLYYNESWTVLSLLMMTGHFADLTAPN